MIHPHRFVYLLNQIWVLWVCAQLDPHRPPPRADVLVCVCGYFCTWSGEMLPSCATMALRQDREPRRGTASPTRRYLWPFVVNTSVTHIGLRGAKGKKREEVHERRCICVCKGGRGRKTERRMNHTDQSAKLFCNSDFACWHLLPIPNTPGQVINILVCRHTRTHIDTSVLFRDPHINH